jgi:hypothetical protein
MSIRTFVLTLALAALVAPSVLLAQQEHRATVLLRSGERVSGTLEDVENGTVFVRVSLHDQRKLPVGDVALIDLVGGASGLPETELTAARGNNHVALLRGGESMQGNLVDIRGGETGGSGDLAMIFRTSGGDERRVDLNSVSRIYLGNFPATTAVTDNAPRSASSAGGVQPDGSIRVPGNTTWVQTPLTVRKGDTVRFNVTGQIQLSDDSGDMAHAAGSLKQRRAAGSPLPQNFAGALIAKVGNSAPFPIGDQTGPVTMPADGQLYLGINDDEVSDNRGEFIVRVSRDRR